MRIPGAPALFLIFLLTTVLLAGCQAGSNQSATERIDPAEIEWSRNDKIPRFSTEGWATDFARHTVSFGEILPGGVPRDGIPPIYQPKFETVTQADGWLDDSDPLAFLRIGETVRAYPLRILIWHEIVNDEVAGSPVVISYCPLCNTVVAQDRRVDGRALTFGVSGLLRHSDLVMWDHETESFWQQATGEGIVGEMAGQQLDFLPASLVGWKEFKASFPGASVLSRDTGYSREYGTNPYGGYDTSWDQGLFDRIPDPRLAALERVIGVNIAGEPVAYPFSALFRENIVNDTISGRKLVIFYQIGAASAVDRDLFEESRRVGSATVFDAVLNGRKLTFEKQGGQIVDRQTGSTWDFFGKAIDGELAGHSLEPLIHGTHFWFAWDAFNPETRIYGQK